MQATIPRDRAPDSTLALWRDGYLFMTNRRRRHQSEIFETRLLGKRAICLHGPHAAQLLYDSRRFKRAGALPGRILKTLMGRAGVQTLDGEAHHARKQMFMTLMTPANIDALVRTIQTQWWHALTEWHRMKEVVLFEEVQRLLCRAVCDWAGVPLSDDEVSRRAKDLGAMIDGFGGLGLRYWRGRRARNRSEGWIAQVVDEVRVGRLRPPDGSVIEVFAHQRDIDGALLDRRTAAVEVLNVLRPVVAIATFITFAALALHDYPHWRERIRAGNDEDAELFVQEVRRFYPFTPAIGAVVAADFEWRGHQFRKGTLALVDVYGMHHDPDVWAGAVKFDPDRFAGWEPGAFDFVPQGGGGYERGHRCAGEWITIAVMKAAVQLLAGAMVYVVPPQDTTIDLGRIPTLPASGFVIADVGVV